ncbi:MAG: hypothetical protein H0T84_06755 [Tatlockia sp.]|nr:hypothetical protein [Tatlockia sp.]
MIQVASFGSDLIPIIISAVVLTIMIFSIFITAKYNDPDLYKKTRIHVFFSTLASAAIIFVGINIILSSISYKNNQRFIRLNTTKEAIDKYWLYPNELLSSLIHIRPDFRASFFMNNPKMYMVSRTTKKNSPQGINTLYQEQFIANVIIQAWEDCLNNRNYDLTPFNLWLSSFLVWAQSPYLKVYYDKFIYGYEDRTKQLGDLLFKYAATLPIPTNSKDYEAAVEKILNDSRYISLMESTR